MPNTTSVNLLSLDVSTIKENLKTYLSSQDIFKDYDFEGSNISVLLDILSYNTYLNAFYMNMVSNEMFLDSALLRDSVVSHAKELNYLPRGFRSAYANVNIKVTDPAGSSSEYTTVLIPKGSSFTGRSGTSNFTFVTDQNIIAAGSNGVFQSNDVLLYEGDYIIDSYTVNNSNPVRYIISNRTVDTNSITVLVIEDNGSNILTYLKASSLFGLNSSSQVFFIQPAENDTFEIIFGDGVIGRQPADNSTVIIQYRDCNGELPNGIRTFISDGAIDGLANVQITVNTAATGGQIPETNESIKYNAPRAFTTQERVVTADDYSTLLIANFSEISSVFAYGGEDAIPPQYGKVFVAIDLKISDSLPASKRLIYTKFLKEKSPLAIDPVFISPSYTYVKVVSTVKYNINQTSLSTNDIQTLAESAIISYNNVYLDGFNKTLYYSKFLASIDAAHSAIVGNDTEIYVTKSFIPSITNNSDYTIDFGVALRNDLGQIEAYHDQKEFSVITSSKFVLNGIQCFIEDDGNGILRVVTQDNFYHNLVKNIGTVDYDNGILSITNFKVDYVLGSENLFIYGSSAEKNIESQRNTILKIRNEDIHVSVQQVRI